MLGLNVCSDTTLRTPARAMSRLGRLCGVFGVLLFSWGGFFAGCQTSVCDSFDPDDGNACTEDSCDDVDGVATAVNTPVDCGDQTCNPADGACVDCLADADCDPGFCSEAGGNVCVECLLDVQCAVGQVCENGQCVDESECAVDEDCAAGEVCTNGECVTGGGTGGDAAAGEAFYAANNCAACHVADASGGFGPNIQGASAEEIFAVLSGAEPHTGGTVDGVTEQDALDLEAWLGSL